MKNIIIISLAICLSISLFVCTKVLRDNQRILNNLLFYAVSRGDVTLIQAAIANGAQINSKHASSAIELYLPTSQQPLGAIWTPLHQAVFLEHPEIVTLLLKEGADIDGRSNKSKTPLDLAAMKGDLEIIRLLIDHGAELKPKRGERTSSPLWLATNENHNDVASLLREKGATFTAFEQKNLDSKLYNAAIANDIENLKDALARGASINNAPIHRIANSGNVRALEILLDAGIDVDNIGSMGETLLHQACRGGSVETVELLLLCGADINAKDNSGHVPFLWAMYNGQREIMPLLLEKGANVNIQDKEGVSLLQHAKNSNRPDIYKLLLNHGAQEEN